MTPTDSRTRDDILGPVLARLPSSLGAWAARAPRAVQAARDITAVVTAWTTKRPVSRRYGSPSSTTMPGERRLRVLSVRRETNDALSLVLERPVDLTFVAGQFLTLVLHVEGKEIRRSYSLSSAPQDPAEPLVITIKRVDDGIASRWLHAHAEPGMVLRVRGPSGNFTYEPTASPPHVLLIAGGSGITPIMGILRTALAHAQGAKVTLLYANKTEADVIFHAELARLARETPRLSVRHVLENAHDAFEGERGRVTRSHLDRALDGVDVSHVHAYVCGPQPMMTAVTSDLLALGLSEGSIKIERFASLRQAPATAQNDVPHRLVVGGKLAVIPAGKTVLEGAIAARVDLDFSCTMGGCGACKARLVKGEVILEEPNCLTAEERASGMILTCIARPQSDITLEKL